MKERSGMPYDVVAFSTDEHALLFTLEEEGAFHRLMRHAWINGSIPDDTLQLSRICRCNSPSHFRKIWPALAPLWPKDPVDPARRLNSKQESEREYKDSKSEKAKVSAAKRWQAERIAKAVGESTKNAMPTHSEGNAPLPSPPRLSASSKLKENTDSPFVPPLEPKPKRAVRSKTEPPEVLDITNSMREWAHANGFDDATIQRETPAMLDHFRGEGKNKKDWPATWRNWLRKSNQFNRNGARKNGTRTSEELAAINTAVAAKFINREVEPGVHGDLPDDLRAVVDRGKD